MISRYLNQTCFLITEERNAYGDYIYVSSEEVACRYREISTIRYGNKEEILDTDAMIWFASDQPVDRGTIIKVGSVYYQVERVFKARRLGESDVQFIKCELKIKNIAVS